MLEVEELLETEAEERRGDLDRGNNEKPALGMVYFLDLLKRNPHSLALN